MNLSKLAFHAINTLISNDPPETGGILGSKEDNVITDIIMDEPTSLSEKTCCYSPNVDFFNSRIETWTENRISFKGIFHTHFFGVETLSDADKKYICAIMKSMPNEITYLYFPIFVLPDRKLVCYKAEKANKEIKICYEDVIII